MNPWLAIITAPALTVCLLTEPWITLASMAILGLVLACAIWLADRLG